MKIALLIAAVGLALASPAAAADDANFTVAALDWTLENCPGQPIHPVALMGVGIVKPETTPETVKAARAELEAAIEGRFSSTVDACNSIMVMWAEAGQTASK